MRRATIVSALFAALGAGSARADEPAAPRAVDATSADAGHDATQPARPELRPRDLVKPKPDKGLDEMLLRGVTTIPLSTLVDETIDDVIVDLKRLDVTRISPLAIRTVDVSPNLKATFALDLEHRFVAALAQSTTIKQVECTGCRALRSRVENGDWVVSLGPVNQAELAALGRDLGVRAFLEIDFNFDSGTNVVSTRVRLVRPDDGVILWSEAYTSDTVTAALVRGREREQTREERAAELERLLAGRPYYGYQVELGAAVIPWANPSYNPLVGITLGLRLYELFGPDKRSSFGLHFEGMVNITAPVFGAFLGLGYMYQITDKTVFLPDIRVGAEVGGFLAGTQGNTGYLEANAQVMLKYRFGVGVGLFYMLATTLEDFTLGGSVGFRGMLTFTW